MYISTEQRKVLIIAISITILLVADISFILLPLINKTFDLSSRVSSTRKNIDNLNQQISTIDETREKLSRLKESYRKYVKRFSREEEIPQLLETLSKIAAESEVAILAVRPAATQLDKQDKKLANIFREVPIEIRAMGGYHQLGSFINKLETLDRFLKVTDISITQNINTPRNHSLRLLVATYILKESMHAESS